MCGHPRPRVFRASTSTATLPSIASSSGSNPIARTSCVQRHAAAILAAHFSASSREGTSTIVIPPMIRSRTVGDRPVRAHEIRGFLFQAAGQEVHTGVDELLTDRVRSPAHLGHLLVGDVVHRVAGERDQVLRHRMSFLSHRIDRRHPTYPRTLCMGSDRCQRGERAALRPHATAALRARSARYCRRWCGRARSDRR
jgi:hypothetical protein